MKMKAIIPVLLILFLFSSCYTNNYNSHIVIITDNGPSYEDTAKHIITIEKPSSYNSITYSTDGKDPVASDLLYSPSNIKGIDGNTYSGVLVSEGLVVKAAAFKAGVIERNIRSIIAELKVEEVKITYPSTPVIINMGVYASDTGKFIIHIENRDSSPIYYTLDGSDPDSDDTLYIESSYTNTSGTSVMGILVDKGKTIKAVSKSGLLYSNIVSLSL